MVTDLVEYSTDLALVETDMIAGVSFGMCSLASLLVYTIFVAWDTLKCRAMMSRVGPVKHMGVQCMIDKLDPVIVGRMTNDNVREELRKMEMATSGTKD